jgi:hypothetical protein
MSTERFVYANDGSQLDGGEGNDTLVISGAQADS